MLQDRESVRGPSSLDAIVADPETRAAVVFLVEVRNRAPKSVRIKVTLPQDLIVAIDLQTRNRSRFLAEAVTRRRFIFEQWWVPLMPGWRFCWLSWQVLR